MARGQKKTPATVTTTKGKQPVISPDNVMGKELRFRFHLVDVDSEWCLSKITPEDHKGLLKKLKSFESMTVGEVFKGHPGKDYDSVPHADANKRLMELFDSTEVSRLRVDGAARLYGVRQNEYFAILWWDPEHQIWASEK